MNAKGRRAARGGFTCWHLRGLGRLFPRMRLPAQFGVGAGRGPGVSFGRWNLPFRGCSANQGCVWAHPATLGPRPAAQHQTDGRAVAPATERSAGVLPLSCMWLMQPGTLPVPTDRPAGSKHTIYQAAVHQTPPGSQRRRHLLSSALPAHGNLQHGDPGVPIPRRVNDTLTSGSSPGLLPPSHLLKYWGSRGTDQAPFPVFLWLRWLQLPRT